MRKKITAFLMAVSLFLASPFEAGAIGVNIVKEYTSTMLPLALARDIDVAGDWNFFATDEGLVQFDGVSADLFPMNNRYPARSVFIDKEEGRIYVAGINEFGYFEPSPLNSLEYVCLSDSLGDDRYAGNMWGIYSSGDKLTIQGDAEILITDHEGHNLEKIHSPFKLDKSAMIDGVLWLATDNGLKFLMGKTITDAPGADELKGKRIRAILPHGDVLIAVTSDGVYSYDRTRLERLTEADEALRLLGEIFCADIRDNKLALGSIDHGIGIVDLSTGSCHIYNEDNGMTSNTAISLKFDDRGDLWGGMHYGLNKIMLEYPVEVIANSSSSIGSGYVMAKHDGKIYFGTNRGLYYSDYREGEDLSRKTMRYVDGTRGQVWGLSVIGDELFCAHDRGLFLIKGGNAVKTGNFTGVWDIQKVGSDPSRAYVGTYFGGGIIKKRNGRWSEEHPIEGYPASMYNFVQETPAVIWTDDGEGGIYRLDVDTVGYKVTSMKNYKKTSDGFPLTADIYISRIDNDVTFSTPNGIYRYEPASDKIIKAGQLEELLGLPKTVRRLKKTGGSLYALTDKELIQGDPAGILGIRRIPLMEEIARPMGDKDVFFYLDEGYLGYPIREGYMFFDFKDNSGVEASRSLPLLSARINRLSITSAKDSTVYRSNFLDEKPEIVLTHDDNSIRFEFGSPEMTSFGVLYSTRLNNGHWSTPAATLSKEYTRLREGNYTFEVRATGAGGATSTDSVSFKVLPPWWRSPWAIIIYILLAMMAAWGLILLEKRRVNRKQKNLLREKDEEMARRQERYEWEAREKDHKIVELEKEQLDKELRHKAQEISNIMISLTHKNETLRTVKKELQQILPLIPRASADARKAIVELQGKVTVDINSDDVLKRVEEEFDLVHDNFMKKLRESYPDLSHNEVLMCAYIKMNLSTKEIAPLLNISVRGAETIRYRLRKKLNLEREESLTDFLRSGLSLRNPEKEEEEKNPELSDNA